MVYLPNYIGQQNHFRAMFNLQPLSMPTNFEEARPIFQKVASELSPENLHRDGEASAQEAQDKRDFLNIVWEELETISGRQVSESDVY